MTKNGYTRSGCSQKRVQSKTTHPTSHHANDCGQKRILPVY